MQIQSSASAWLLRRYICFLTCHFPLPLSSTTILNQHIFLNWSAQPLLLITTEFLSPTLLKQLQGMRYGFSQLSSGSENVVIIISFGVRCGFKAQLCYSLMIWLGSQADSDLKLPKPWSQKRVSPSILLHNLEIWESFLVLFSLCLPYPTNIQGYTICITNSSQTNPLHSFSMLPLQSRLPSCLAGLQLFIFVFSSTYSLQLLGLDFKSDFITTLLILYSYNSS